MRRLVAQLLERELHDPRLAGVRVTAARVSPDLRQATLFWSLYPAGEAEGREAERALLGAAGFLRRAVAHEVRLRVAPELRFVRDRSLERAAHIDEVLREIGGERGAGEEE